MQCPELQFEEWNRKHNEREQTAELRRTGVTNKIADEARECAELEERKKAETTIPTRDEVEARVLARIKTRTDTFVKRTLEQICAVLQAAYTLPPYEIEVDMSPRDEVRKEVETIITEKLTAAKWTVEVKEQEHPNHPNTLCFVLGGTPKKEPVRTLDEPRPIQWPVSRSH